MANSWRIAPIQVYRDAETIQFQREADALSFDLEQKRREQYRAFARQQARQYGIDEDIFDRQISQESGFNPTALSRAGARGIAQIMPNLHPNVNPDDPYESLTYAAKLMRGNLDHYNGDYRRALAAYNAGQGNVDEYGDVPPFEETQTYVRNILMGRTDLLARSPQKTPINEQPRETPPFYQESDEVGPIAEATFQTEYKKRLPHDFTRLIGDGLARLLDVKPAFAAESDPLSTPLTIWDLPVIGDYARNLQEAQQRKKAGLPLRYGGFDPLTAESAATGALFGMLAGPLGGLAGATVGAVVSKIPVPGSQSIGEVLHNSWQWLDERVGQPFVGLTLERADRSLLTRAVRDIGDRVNDTYVGPFKNAPGLGWFYNANKVIRSEVAKFSSWIDPLLLVNDLPEISQRWGALQRGELHDDAPLREAYKRWQKIGADYQAKDPFGYLLLSFGNPVYLADYTKIARLPVKAMPPAMGEAFLQVGRKITFNALEPSSEGLVRQAIGDAINATDNLFRIVDEPGSVIKIPDLVGQIRAGTVDPQIVNASFDTSRLSGLRWKEALDDLIEAAKTPSLKEPYDNLMENLSRIDRDQIQARLGTILQKYRAEKLGVEIKPFDNVSRWYSTFMATWRPTVLRTPNYVIQNFIEDYSRALLNGYFPILTHLDSYRNRYGHLLPYEMRQRLITFDERLRGFRTLEQVEKGTDAQQILATVQDQLLNETAPAIATKIAPMADRIPGNVSATLDRAINVPLATADVLDVGTALGITIQAMERNLNKFQRADPELSAHLDRLGELAESLKARKPPAMDEAEIDDFILGSQAAVDESDIERLVANKAADPFRAARMGPLESKTLPIGLQEFIRENLKSARTPEEIRQVFQPADEQLLKWFPEAKREYAKNARKELRDALAAEIPPEDQKYLDTIPDMWADIFVNERLLTQLDEDVVEAGKVFEQAVMDNRALEMGYGTAAVRTILDDTVKSAEIIKSIGLEPGRRKLDRLPQLHAIITKAIAGVNAEAMAYFDKFRTATLALSRRLVTEKDQQVALQLWQKYIADHPDLTNSIVGLSPSKDSLWNNYFPMRRAFHQKRMEDIAQFVNDKFMKLDMDELRQVMPKPSQYAESWRQVLTKWEEQMVNAISQPAATNEIGRFWFEAGNEAKALQSGLSEEAALANVKARNSAIQFASDEAGRIMHIATRELNIDRIMRPIFPFWFFPSRAHPFYVETVLNKPWTLNTLYNYFNATSGDPVADPRRLRGFGVSLAEAPLIGPALKRMGVDFRLNPALFMGFYQYYSPKPIYNKNDSNLQRALDVAGMMGVGPGPVSTITAQAASRRLAEIFNLPPALQPLARDLLPQERIVRPITSMALAALHADQATKIEGPSLSDVFLPLINPEPRPFFGYDVAKQLQGIFGEEIQKAEQQLGRRLTPIELEDLEKATFESKEQREKAAMAVNIVNLMGGIVPGKPVFMRELENRKQINDWIQKRLGVSEEDLKKDVEEGQPIIWRLNREQRTELFREQPHLAGMERVIPPEVDPRFRRVYVATSNFWTEVAAARRDLIDKTIPLSHELNNGKISGKQFREEREKLFTQYRIRFESLRATNEEAITTREQKDKFRLEMGQEITSAHPEDLALEEYWQITPELFKKPDGSTDWPAFFANRKQYIANLAPEIGKYVASYESGWLRYLKDTDSVAYRIEQERQQAMLDYDYYSNNIPKYIGLNREQADSVDYYVRLVDETMAAIPLPKRTEAMALFMIARDQGVGAAKLAGMMLQLSRKLRNPMRHMYWASSPSLRKFFGDLPLEDLPASIRP